MNKKRRETQRGITLIALVITIIVMLILVGVTISMAVNGGLFNYAGKASGETKNALNAEQELANGGIEVDGVWYGSINEYLNKDKERISKTKSYVGYYADVDADGAVDGVIYADLVFDKSGQWGSNENGTYTINKVTDVKDYYISKTNYEGIFGTKDVLTAIGQGDNRFYVMALSDISTSEYTWYESKGSDGKEVVTSGDFGKGKENTATMIAAWNADTDETKSSNDVWGHIQTQANKGWFLPSRAEWGAFLKELNIDDFNYEDYEISDIYWTSSQSNTKNAFCPDLFGYYINNEQVNLTHSVRLSTIF